MKGLQIIQNIKSFWNRYWNKILAIVIFVVVFTNQFINIYIEEMDWGELLWFCDAMSFALAAGLWFKNRFIVSVVLTAAIPAQFLWIVDFFLQMGLGEGLGRTAWLFEDNDLWITPWVSTLMHGLLIPVSFYGVYRLGYSIKSIWGVYFVIFALLVPSYLFTNPEDNRNCIFYPCDLYYNKDFTQIISAYMSPEYMWYSIFHWIVAGSLVWFGLVLVFKWWKRVKIFN